MANLRTYGEPPFAVALLHGGPGAPGEMAPVARELASRWSVLEPLQTAMSVEVQIQELRAVLEERGDPPITLVGHSWGAWLGVLLAAAHPELVEHLILVGSGPFEAHYAAGMLETRLGRLSEEEREEAHTLLAVLDDPGADSGSALARLGALFSKADSYDPLGTDPMDPDSGRLPVQQGIYRSVWDDANRLRAGGELLRRAGRICCPVLAIHGDHDPHPAQGVNIPLSAALIDFRFVLLDRCGHTPWLERQARDRFYALLHEELLRTAGAAAADSMMRVRVQAHGMLTIGIDDPSGVTGLLLPRAADVTHLIAVLSRSSSFFDHRSCLAFIAGAKVPLSHVLQEGDEVHLYLPFGGG